MEPPATVAFEQVVQLLLKHGANPNAQVSPTHMRHIISFLKHSTLAHCYAPTPFVAERPGHNSAHGPGPSEPRSRVLFKATTRDARPWDVHPGCSPIAIVRRTPTLAFCAYCSHRAPTTLFQHALSLKTGLELRGRRERGWRLAALDALPCMFISTAILNLISAGHWRNDLILSISSFN